MYILTTIDGKKLCAGSYEKCYGFWEKTGSRRNKCIPASMWKVHAGYAELAFDLGVTPR